MNLNIVFDLVIINFLGVGAVMNTIKGEKNTGMVLLAGIGVFVTIIIAGIMNYLLVPYYSYSIRFLALPVITFFSGTIAGRIFGLIKNRHSILYYNTAVCGIMVIANRTGLSDFFGYLLMHAACGTGFILLLLAVHAVVRRTETRRTAVFFRAEPMVLLILGLLSLLISGMR
ncbi:MAG: hypothetical protein ABIH89_03950 [Elusimicrobiota bacterium]